MRPLVAAVLFAAAAAGLISTDAAGQQQPPQKKQKKKVDPAANKPDEATLKLIAEKTQQLGRAVAALKAQGAADDVFADVEVYRKAAEWTVRHGEWFVADGGKSTLTVLDRGLDRAKAAAGGRTPWRDVRGKPVVRGYLSRVDGSVQPYSVVYPEGFDPQKQYRLDVVLHGRDDTSTEVKFINGKENAKAGKAPDHFVLEVYGRGNNAYRWAGEADVFEALAHCQRSVAKADHEAVDPNRIVLRGFSMGGAGTWHIGLHRPDEFCVIGPGAGFTTTHGYIGNLPAKLPDYQEKCLHIYDALDYAENAFNVPVVAYSGENDGQKKAADNIENALKGFQEPLRFTHLIAPGLEHKMPPEWQAKAEAEYRKYADKGRDPRPERVRLVTYTPAYGRCDWLFVMSLDRTYERAVVDARREGNRYAVTTTNVRALMLGNIPEGTGEWSVTIDGQKPDVSSQTGPTGIRLVKTDGRWAAPTPKDGTTWTGKYTDRQGPIDDCFRRSFKVAGPTRPDGFAAARMREFAALWDRYFRGALPVIEAKDYARTDGGSSLVLFGDPETNPLIAEALPKLPITWTKEKLVVNGVGYDPKTHVPVLIYPNPLTPGRYVVINSGHTFKEADLKGTNALLYPRLGDWAVLKPTPTEKDPAAYEVVAAGLFDENWQFPKK